MIVKQNLDYMIATLTEQFAAMQYTATVKPFGYFTAVKMGQGFMLYISHHEMSYQQVNSHTSLIGGIAEAYEVLAFCSKISRCLQIQMITAD